MKKSAAAKPSKSININPANKGKFTAKAKAAGKTVTQFENEVLSAPKNKHSAKTREQASFARNAKKFNHNKKGK